MGLGGRFRRSGQPGVSDEVSLKVRGVDDLAAPSRARFMEAVKDYSVELLAEAGRLEANARRHKGDALITAHHIEHADLQVRNGFSPRTGGRRYNALDSIAFSAAIGAGVCGGKLDASWGPLGLVLSAIIGIIAYATRGSK